jgi:anti-anti-sigma factor
MKPGLKFEARESGPDAVVRVSGRLVGGSDAPILISLVRRLLAHGVRRIAIDLSGARMMDCSGLGLVLACRRAAARQGAVVRVLRAPAAIRGMFEASRLFDLLEAPDDARTAAGGALALSA